MTRTIRAVAALLLAGCAGRGAGGPLPPVIRSLAAELDSAFAAPQYARAEWGVVVQSLDNGQVLYRRNADHLFMPASNQKLITGAVALARLGPEFRFTTTVLASGARRGDTLHGDLVVYGRGDPALSLRASGGTDILASLRPWADSLRARGIRAITGRVTGDASYFPDPFLGEGWMWDDLQDSYSAPVGALMFNEAFATVTLTPGLNPGDPLTARLEPADAPLRVFSTAITAPRDSAISQVRWTRAFFTDSVPVWGRLSAGRSPFTFFVAVTDPTRYFERALGQVLREAGIAVLNTPSVVGHQSAGTASSVVGRQSSGGSPVASDDRRLTTDTIFSWQSPRLDSILKLLEKPSQNQIAEILVRTLGTLRGGVASFDSGRVVVRETLLSWGVPEDAYVFADGSGLSRYNYVAPTALAHTLTAMARHPAFTAFYDALPIAGVDGTIQRRMAGTAAANNARAKTGSISNARTLSGYVTTAEGERLVFVLMANHFTVPSRVVDRTQDHIVERLANFRRGQ
jgi:serine-type D-Ala-D-Ala carboxypeptidase/endopeptidase (penicillin-binding protein 4)